MGFVTNGYRNFVRLHYDHCHSSKADRPEDRWIQSSWYDCDTNRRGNSVEGHQSP